MKVHRLWLLVLAVVASLLWPPPVHAVSLNASGSVAHGLAGTTTSVDNRAVAAGGGGESSRWFDDTHVIYQRNADLALALYDTVSGATSVVDARGANNMRANGGVWAAWLAGTGVFSSTGMRLPDAGLLDVGPDGAIAYTPIYQSGRGAIVRDVGGHELTLDGGDWVVGLELLGGGRAIWTNGITIRTAGIPPVTMVAPAIWRPRAAEVGGEWWVAYWTETRGLVLHPFASPFGYVLRSTPDAFSHDVRAIAGRLRVAFATNLGESAGSVVVIDVDLSAPRTDLRVTAPAPPVPDAPPQPTAPQPAGLTDAQFTTLERVRAKYGAHVTPQEIGAILNEVAWIHRGEGLGLQAKAGGTVAFQPRTNRMIWNGIRIGNVGQDVLGGASIGLATPTRGEAGPADPASFVAPVEPIGTVPPVDPPGPIVVPPPVAGVTRAELAAAIALAKQTLREEFEAEFGHLEERIERVEQRPLDLPALQAAIDAALLNYEVNGKTRTDRLGLQHVVQVPITRRK
jgi:hypothetical protein